MEFAPPKWPLKKPVIAVLKSTIGQVEDAFRRLYPQAKLLVPHEKDWNSTHVGTHYLVNDALKTMEESFCCGVCETEFWAPMGNPNLMIESSVADVTDLVTALSFHVGEVSRNPYHVRLPAWMQDNVRRGGELVGGELIVRELRAAG